MTGHLISFTVYTLAMLGIIFVGFVVAQKTLSMGCLSNKKDNKLSIESVLPLEPRKNLYIVKAGNERFLVSTDPNGSHFLTKLESDSLSSIQTLIDENSIDSKLEEKSESPLPQNSMVRRMLEKLNANSGM